MKVLLTKKFADADIDYINSKLDDGVELHSPSSFNEAGVLTQIGKTDVIFGGLLSEEIVKNSTELKFAQIPWTGVDNLNFELFQKYSLTVCNSHSNSVVVAEHAIALAFSLAKKITYHDAQMRKGNWNRVSNEGNLVSPFSAGLMRKNIVFIGFGAIGQSIYKMLSGFEPQVVAVTNSGINKSGMEDIEMYKSADILRAVKSADLVFVCAPLTPETENLVDQSVFDSMPDHALLVNVSRGNIVSESALHHSLAQSVISGAGIDTWYQNPNPKNEVNYPSAKYAFQELNNLIMSPHRAGYIDSGFPHLDDAVENLNRAYRGLPLLNVVSSTNAY